MHSPLKSADRSVGWGKLCRAQQQMSRVSRADENDKWWCSTKKAYIVSADIEDNENRNFLY